MLTIANTREDIEPHSSSSLLWGVQSSTAIGRQSDNLTKLNIVLPYGPVMTILGSYPKELEALFTQKSACGCLQQLHSLLADSPTSWKQSRCPLADEWISTLWCIQTCDNIQCQKNDLLGNRDMEETPALITMQRRPV